MKKPRRALITAAALLLTGCAGDKSDSVGLDKDIRCSVSVSGDRSYSAELERVDNSGWKVSLTSPESAKGIELGYMNDGYCTVTVQGHTIVYPEADIPDSGVFDLILSAADNCIENRGVSFERQGDKYEAKGTIRGMSFTATTDDSCITSIELGGKIKADFTYAPVESDE